jgi:hypothetical protein
VPAAPAMKKEVRMAALRMLMLMLLVVTITSLPIATPTAGASGFDEAYWFAQYLCENYLGCE